MTEPKNLKFMRSLTFGRFNGLNLIQAIHEFAAANNITAEQVVIEEGRHDYYYCDKAGDEIGYQNIDLVYRRLETLEEAQEREGAERARIQKEIEDKLAREELYRVWAIKHAEGMRLQAEKELVKKAEKEEKRKTRMDRKGLTEADCRRKELEGRLKTALHKVRKQ